MYRQIIRLLTTVLLLIAALHPCRAQWVDPDDGPDLNWKVAKMDGMEYTSLAEAFEAVTADGKEITLLIGIIQDAAGVLAVDYTTTLNLGTYQLTGASGTEFEIATGKMLAVKNGTLSGSFILKGDGNLFAGTDVSMKGVGVTGGTPLQNLYRVLVELPGGEAVGTVSGVTYGNTRTTRWARQGNRLCLWLPHSMAALRVTFTYTPAGSASSQIYATAPLTVTQHAENAAGSEKSDDVVANVAEATQGATTTTHLTLEGAFKALMAEGTIRLLANTSLKEKVQTVADTEFSLNNWELTASASAGFTVDAGKRLRVKSGSLAGSFTVEGDVVADRTVQLTAAVMKAGKQVYRTRLVLPDGTVDGTPLTYTYGADTDVPAKVLIEGATPVAYLWLPAHVASRFSLTIGGTNLLKDNVVIQANHDNNIDLHTGDSEVVLYSATETPGTDPGTFYATFHEGLEAAGKMDGSQLWLQRDVSLSGETDHSHKGDANVKTELHLDGHTLTGENCMLDASEPGACLSICDADRGTGRITGTFRIKGNIFIGKDVAAANIGMVLSESKMQLYRVLVTLNTTADVDGAATYSLGTAADVACYIKDKVACLWLPASVQPETLTLVADGNSYTAGGVQVIASHGNTVVVNEPAVVARIGTTPYTSLVAAFAAATDGDEIVLQQSTKLATSVTIADGTELKLDLEDYTLEMPAATGFTTTGTGTLDIYSSTEKGSLSGNFSVTAGVCAESSVSLPGMVTLSNQTVYRTEFFLPAGANNGTWSYNAQSGTLFFPGKTNTTGQAVAYGWLEVEGGTHDLTATLTGTVGKTCTLTDILIQATHNNRFDMEAGSNVAKVGTQYYPSFASALAAVQAAGGGTIQLVADQALRGVQKIDENVVVDMNGKRLSTTADAAFDVSAATTLKINDQGGSADKGFLYGTLLLNGRVYISDEVKLSGTIVRDGKEVYRLTVEGLPSAASLDEVVCKRVAGGEQQKVLLYEGGACLWLPAITVEEDLQLTVNGEVYETTLIPSLPDHNTNQKAYRLVSIDADATWGDAMNKDCNVVVAPGKTLIIEAGSGLNTLHRLTLGNGSQLKCDDPVVATAGIVYHRTFAVEERWEGFSLPYEPRSITAIIDGRPVALSPYLISGTGGHFWLRTLAGDDSFQYVAEERVEANKGYIIAVPEGLTTHSDPDMAVLFVSPPNQFLNRRPLAPEKPAQSEYRQQSTGVLYTHTLDLPFYQLNAVGTEYERQMASTGSTMEVPPFSSYLLTDDRTVATHATLRMAGLPTGNETPVPVADCLRISGGKGCVWITTATETLIRVCTFDGRLHRVESVPAGTTRLPLAAGLYIVDRTKIYVTE
ncbi:MAG: hypothetical protein ACK5N4_03490 [Parabacteroides gordonii]|uniref:hypothetical protein n=1 Tax=Parabacteroides gordonii TaxID=574930 RepID=UPI003A887896